MRECHLNSRRWRRELNGAPLGKRLCLSLTDNMSSPKTANSSRQKRKAVDPSSQRRRSVDDPTLVSFLWPIVLGVLVTFLTIRVAGILVMMGQQEFAMLYPWVALVRSPLFRIDYGSAVAIGQVLMYFQFPIYGVIAGTLLYSTNKFTKAFFTVVSVHLVALIAFVAIWIFYQS